MDARLFGLLLHVAVAFFRFDAREPAFALDQAVRVQIKLDHIDVILAYLEFVLPPAVEEVIYSVHPDRCAAPTAAVHWLLEEAG